ncbi:hypothetical protein Syun_028842 [Stephania yunnanensis]|uniref:glutathione transferase n=1 Tax=Stephania yunnanensis TaxID=152371 RepID=A0AAP0E7I9_9MAGN
MAPLKVYGNVFSTATQRVFACLHEKNLDYDFVNVDLSIEEHKQPPHLARNPFGLVPAFEDGDLKLFESRAITLHVSYAYQANGTPLMAEDKKMPIQSVWMEVEAHQFEPTTGKLVWEVVFKPMLGMTTDDEEVVESEKKLEEVLEVYEARLKESKYLGGECFTLADLHHLPNIQCLFGTPVKKHFEARPHVKAWCEDIMARPAWVKVIQKLSPPLPLNIPKLLFKRRVAMNGYDVVIMLPVRETMT